MMPAPKAADDKVIDALEAKAEKADEKAQSAREKADELADAADVAAAAAEDAGGAKDDHCPDCGTRLMHYEGDNPHKAGQGFCRKCGARKPLGADR